MAQCHWWPLASTHGLCHFFLKLMFCVVMHGQQQDLLKITSLYWQMFLLFLSYQICWLQKMLSRHLEINDWIQSRILTEIKSNFSSESLGHMLWQKHWFMISVFKGCERWFSACLKLCSWGLHNFLPHQTSMGLFFKTLNALLKICIHNTFPTQQYKTVQSLL